MSDITIWGPNTWNLLHCLTIKIKDNEFNNIKNIIINNILNIISNLPCQECSKHGINFMNNVIIDNIKSKEILIDLIFLFHNSVNKRCKKTQYNKDNLLDEYNSLNFKQVCKNFVNTYQVKNNMKLLTISFNQKNVLKQFINFITKNINKFND